MWPVSTDRPCDHCGDRFRHIPSFIMVPGKCVCAFGNYCSWNCAKRALLRLRTRPWFALMAITALKTGAKLPISIEPTDKSCRPVKIPPSLQLITIKEFIQINPPNEKTTDIDNEPEAFEEILPMITEEMRETSIHDLQHVYLLGPHTVPSKRSTVTRNHPPLCNKKPS